MPGAARKLKGRVKNGVKMIPISHQERTTTNVPTIVNELLNASMQPLESLGD